jgi:hypothetical protein
MSARRIASSARSEKSTQEWGTAGAHQPIDPFHHLANLHQLAATDIDALSRQRSGTLRDAHQAFHRISRTPGCQRRHER